MLNQNNMPGAGSIADTMEFMRKMWGSMGAPAMGIPSLSVEEINKKIADLKTVASWLELNMNMLRATIQALEVQSATLSTLQAMGAILTPSEAPDKGVAESAAANPFSFANWPQPSARTAPAKAPPEPQPEPRVEDMEEEPEPDADSAPAASASTVPEPEPESVAASGALPHGIPTPDFQAAMTNPNAWWNLLQEQFQQAVGNVLAEQETAPKKAEKTAKTAAKPAAKPSAATAAKGQAAAPKKTTKAAPAAKAGTRAKSTVVQSRQSKSVSRKPKSP